ncbi:EamA family transporter [Paraneptunicella aestuarii]|uniref:EamA family transporter n=1 Tax=Paraneptunicella aestuarii TaxID=2831148 RepID=UPI002FCBACFA
MALLWLITALWAFSFSLIGVYLAGQVDAYIAVTSRMALALIIFLPFLRKVDWKQALTLMTIGAIEIGIMYLFLYKSYQYLSVPELLLFTIFTPLYVSLFADLFAKRLLSSIAKSLWLPAVLAVAGAAVIRWTELSGDYWQGFLLIQAANACFAFGQVWYRHHSQSTNVPHKTRFA